tara:strand:+ start:538 stop:957 length:420 start_codon:yes stop_codon:yes gene_type:complete
VTGDPRIIAVLPGGVEQREPWPSEIEFFRSRLDVTGMAADDGKVILSPFSQLTESQKKAVALNEAARIFMDREGLTPEFALTPAQEVAFAIYGPMQARRETIAARLLSGDPTALAPTGEQIAFVRVLAIAMGIESASKG